VDQLADELADVMLYTLQLASVSGVELEAAVLAKLRRNATRTWERDEDPRP
jgi:NTP pyrophosphatase (non-canonical NTP hydrolase)